MYFIYLYSYLRENFHLLPIAFQLIGAFVVFVLSYSISLLLNRVFSEKFFNKFKTKHLSNLVKAVNFPIIWSFFQWMVVIASQEFHWEYKISHIVAEFVTAYLFTKCLFICFKKQAVRRVVAYSIFSIAFLDVLGIFPRLVSLMDGFKLDIGSLKISILSVLKALVIFTGLIWSTIKFSKWVECKIKKTVQIERSLQELFAKFIRITLIAFSVLLTLSSIGLDLSAFAVFSGAVGIGIGFGLQKVISNLICGIILLLDRSIKPGDVIAVDNGKSYGEINRLGARCVSVRTRCGKEHLIPNEEFIIHKSENWSLSDSLVRLKLPMRAGLDSDVHLVLKLLLKSAEGVDRVLTNPTPSVRLYSFSESAIEFELRVWIDDPQNGLSKVRSDIYVNIWDLFKQHGIKIPYPHRQVHISNSMNSASETIQTLLSEKHLKG